MDLSEFGLDPLSGKQAPQPRPEWSLTTVHGLSALLNIIPIVRNAVVLQHPPWLVFHVTRPPSVVQPVPTLPRVATSAVKHTIIQLFFAQWSN